MESQLEFLADYKKYLDKRREALPSVIAARDAFREEVYKEGALSRKVKQLISLAVALRAGATVCIIAHTKSAVEYGASKDEVLEAVSVAHAMGGSTTGIGFWRVVKVLEELGKW